MSVTWRKVWRDLVQHKARSALVVLSTAVGVFALGLVFGLSGVLHGRIADSQRAARLAHITFWGGPFSPQTVHAIGRMSGVAVAEGETVVSFRWKLAGEQDWRDGDLVARADYDAQQLGPLRLLEGAWPGGAPDRAAGGRALAVERLSSHQFGVPSGTIVLVEYGQRERRVPVEGVVRAPVVLPPAWGGDARFYATPETAASLSDSAQGEDFNQLHVRLSSYSARDAERAAERIEARLERAGLSVGGYEISDPDEHWVQDVIDASTLILMVMGVIALGLSGLLIVNTMHAVVAQQVWQIGVLKAVGATSGRVVQVYLATALIYGGLALLLALPPGVIGAHLLATWLLEMLNIEAPALRIAPLALAVQIAAALPVPVLATVAPALEGARISVREAISSHGIGSDFGRGWLDRLIARLRWLPRPLALSLRNTFRRKRRVALTLATLTLSGAMFAMVLSTGASFDRTIAESFSLGEDVALKLDRPRRAWRVLGIAQGVPGVAEAELWSDQAATLKLTSGEERPVRLTGVPPDSAIFAPNIVRGRNLRPGDGRAVIVTFRLAEREGIQVGDAITLNLDGEQVSWTVVGSYLSVDDVSDNFFVPLDVLGRETGTLGRGQRLKVLTAGAEGEGAAAQRALIEALTDALAAERIEVTGSWSVSEELVQSQASFGLLTYLLLVMVVLTGLVGGIGLMSTMSINVVERRREVGVMRAIGASSPAIVGMFVAEGVLVGLLSWVLAAPLSYPGARLFSALIGQAVLDMPLAFVYSASGMLLWLLIVVVLSALASLWPALRAAQLSVRQALAYE